MEKPSDAARAGANVYAILAGVVMVLFFAWVVAEMVGARHHSGTLPVIARIGIGFAAAAIGFGLGFVGLRRRRSGRG